jgi:hypothetical protein
MIGFAGALAAALVVSAGPACAGCLVPAPLVGVTGPYGIVAAIVGYGGYLLVRRFRNRD